MKAIDSSGFQSSYNAAYWKSIGIGLSVHRATDGFGITAPNLISSVDPTFTPRIAADKQIGLASGAYMVLEPHENVSSQVTLFYNQNLTGLACAIDIEPSWQSSNFTPSQALSLINAAYQQLTGLIRRPAMIYTSLSTYEWLGKPAWAYLWLGDWDVTAPPAFSNLAMWQDGQVSIDGTTVDTDVFEMSDGALSTLSGQFPTIESNGTPVALLAVNDVEYYIVASDGGVFSFGGAPFRGSAGNLKLNAPIVAASLTLSTNGYYLVGADGGVFAFGDAVFYGSTASIKLDKPIVSISVIHNGYYLVASDGGVFSFGAATYQGRTIPF